VNVGEAQREESGSYRCVTILGRGRHVLGDTARHRCQKHSCYLQTNVCFHCFCHSWIILLGWNTPEHFDYGYCAGLVVSRLLRDGRGWNPTRCPSTRHEPKPGKKAHWIFSFRAVRGASCCPGARPSGRFSVRATGTKRLALGLANEWSGINAALRTVGNRAQRGFTQPRVPRQCAVAKSRRTVTLSSMILEKFPEVRRLTASEKLIFVSELWNDLEAHPSEVPVAREIIAELDRRMEHFREHPGEFTTWEAGRERILGPPRWPTSFCCFRRITTSKPPLIVNGSQARPETIRQKLLGD